MEDKIYALLSFVGDWMLYIFPLYQGTLELSEQQLIIRKFDDTSNQFSEVSIWFWLIPPLKIYKEKKRAISILSERIMDQKEYKELLHFFDKALVWLYVALAGLLNGIVSTRELLTALSLNSKNYLIVVINLVLILLGIYHAYYRVTDKRNQREMNRLISTIKRR